MGKARDNGTVARLLRLAGGEDERVRRAAALILRDFRPIPERRKAQARRGPPRFEPVPAIVTASAWNAVARGIEQRAAALNSFLRDIYRDQETVRADIIPESAVSDSGLFLPQMIGAEPAGGPHLFLASFDLRGSETGFGVVRQCAAGAWDCVRVPAIREFAMRADPATYDAARIREPGVLPILRGALARCAPSPSGSPPEVSALLDEGDPSGTRSIATSLRLVAHRGADFEIARGRLAVRTTNGLRPVDALWRQGPDSGLDPLAFPSGGRGVPGLLGVYRAGAVAIVNPPGSGILSDSAVFDCTPKIVEHFAGGVPMLPNAASASSRFPAEPGMPARSSEFVLRAYVAWTPEGFRALPGARALPASNSASADPVIRDLWILDG